MYVGTSQPTNPEDDTDQNYTLVGLLVSNDFNGEGNILTAADKAVSGFTSSLVGTRSYSINVEAHRKNVVDDGHKILRDAWVDGADTVYWLITTGNTGDTCVYGEAAVSAYSEANPTDDFTTLAATLNGQGAPTFDTVPS
jgi:predicted secreted protein